MSSEDESPRGQGKGNQIVNGTDSTEDCDVGQLTPGSGPNGFPTSAGGSEAYSTRPPSPTNQATRQFETENWLETQRDRRAGLGLLHGLSPPPDHNHSVPATDGGASEAMAVSDSPPQHDNADEDIDLPGPTPNEPVDS